MPQLKYKDETLEIYIEGRYGNHNIAISADTADGEPYCDVSVNIGYLDEGLFCMDTNNMPADLVDAIVAAGISEPQGYSMNSGFCEYPVHRWLGEIVDDRQ